MSEPEAQRWLRLAREDLAAAEQLHAESEHPARVVRFHAQQAAEKALKAAIIASGATAERTHDLEALAARLPRDWRATELGDDLSDLTEAAVEERYPGIAEGATGEDAARGLATARSVLAAVEADLEREAGR